MDMRARHINASICSIFGNQRQVVQVTCPLQRPYSLQWKCLQSRATHSYRNKRGKSSHIANSHGIVSFHLLLQHHAFAIQFFFILFTLLDSSLKSPPLIFSKHFCSSSHLLKAQHQLNPIPCLIFGFRSHNSTLSVSKMWSP